VNRIPFVFSLMFALLMPAGMTGAASPSPESALELIPIAWQGLGFEIVFMPPRPGFRAMTLPSKHRIEVYARPQDDLQLLAYDIAHEIGHAIDVTYNTTETRRQWMLARGIDPKTQWFGCDRCSDYNTPAGDFAETYAFLLRGPKYFRGKIAPPPTADQIQQLSALIPKGFLP
jgi:hypothetical protein